MTDKVRKLLSARNIYIFIAVLAGIYHVYTGVYRTINPQFDRSIHLLFGLCLLYVASILKRKNVSGKILDIFSILMSFGVCSYIIINYPVIVDRWGTPSTTDLICGALAILLVLDMGRRSIGWVMPALALIFLLYAYFGTYIPGMMGHGGYSIKRITHQMYLTTEGIWGMPLGVSASYIYLFLIFGGFLNVTGIGNFYIQLANALFGKSKGGPAKIAVVASGLMGTVSGSAVANVAATGAFTIPMMKKMGYRNETAGAVESAASTGGQLMPPIMGAAAFVMAEFLAVPYSVVMLGAIIPAVVYYTALYFSVHFEAVKQGLEGLPADKVPPLKPLLKRLYLMSPLIGLFIFLIPLKWTTMRAVIAGLVISIFIAIIDRDSKFDLKTVVDAFVDAAKNAITVIASCAVAGIVVGVINMTGFGLKLSSLIIDVGGGNLLAVLVMIMTSSIIMGMGLPTTPAYIVVAVLGVPALIKLGVLPLAAHMFVFYFGIVSMITPPVALAVYTACSIAESEFWKTALETCKIALPVFVVPYYFVYHPVLLWQGNWEEILFVAVSALVGAFTLAAATSGWLLRRAGLFERLILLIAALAIMHPDLYITTIGVLGFVPVLIYQYMAGGRIRNNPAT